MQNIILEYKNRDQINLVIMDEWGHGRRVMTFRGHFNYGLSSRVLSSTLIKTANDDIDKIW